VPTPADPVSSLSEQDSGGCGKDPGQCDVTHGSISTDIPLRPCRFTGYTVSFVRF
jgi:hypothetical protein